MRKIAINYCKLTNVHYICVFIDNEVPLLIENVKTLICIETMIIFMMQ